MRKLIILNMAVCWWGSGMLASFFKFQGEWAYLMWSVVMAAMAGALWFIKDALRESR